MALAVSIMVNQHSLDKVMRKLQDIPNGFNKAVARASIRVAKQGKTIVSADIRDKVNIKKRDIDKTMVAKKVGKTGAAWGIPDVARLPLKYFGAKQNAAGVAYKLGPKSKGFVPGAFQGPKPGVMKSSWKGNVFVRTGKGRLPIRKLFGVGPYGAFVYNAMLTPTKSKLRDSFHKRLQHEAKFIVDNFNKKK